MKRDYETWLTTSVPPTAAGVLKQIEEYSLKAFKVLGCRDFARLDFRVNAAGVPYFLEVNPLAGLNPRSSDIIIMAGLIGLKYTDVINSILDAALQRYSL